MLKTVGCYKSIYIFHKKNQTNQTNIKNIIFFFSNMNNLMTLFFTLISAGLETFFLLIDKFINRSRSISQCL